MNSDDAFARRPNVGAQIPEKIQKAFDDIAKCFSKKEWEKMKYSQKIIYVYMKRKYEAMTKLGNRKFQGHLPPFMHNKRATDFQRNDSDNDCNRGNQVERPQLSTFSMLQGIFPKIMPKKPAQAEEGNDLKGVSETSGPKNDGKQLCPPGKANTSEKTNKRSGNREAREKEERWGTAHRWSSQTTHIVGPKKGKHAWTHRLCDRKQLVIYEEISDPEEDDE
ncbi:protein SSX3-like isoform X2 [Macaca nemestrina]|uniref:protein SSX3-like isoform X2 n=1 Tax=Macaca nemestrina TaxID=9545 RepID=UPI0039B948CA